MVALAISGTSAAQQAYDQPNIPGMPPMLQRVDPTIADVSPLGESLREVNMLLDLRSPAGFQNVYRMPGHDDLLMRANGGVYAIFPQSVYYESKRGPAAAVPPGTVYSIGMPGPSAFPWQYARGPTLIGLDGRESPTASFAPTERRTNVGTAPALNRVISRRGAQAAGDEWNADGSPDLNPQALADHAPRYEIARATPPDPSTFLKTVVTDDAYRSRRLAELLQRALKASRGEG
jgi:hypothetical protein